MASWTISFFKVQGNISLFANGLMQVAVTIQIKAINPDNTPYTLKASELSTIQLIEYHRPDTELSGTWTYTTTENEYAHTYPSTKSVNFPPDDALTQSQQYWVSTKRVETKEVGARIRQPNGTMITTNSDEFNSFVTLRGYAPILYTLSNVDFSREDTANGKGWDQDNYFLSSKVHPFMKSELSGYKGPNYAVEGLRYCIRFRRITKNKRTHFMWPMGPQRTVKVGITHFEDGRPFPIPITVDITINQRRDAMCFTRLSMNLPDIYGTSWWFDTHVKIYDIFGNWGTFSVRNKESDEGNTIVLENRNTKAPEDYDPVVQYEEDGLPKETEFETA
ncbi:hypothetical protein V8C42DRAFT_346934 [Trichoderma barbatum]